MLDLGHVHDPAVAGDDEGHAGSRQALEAGVRQPVALGQPRRNVADRLRAQRPQRDRPDHDRGHAVRVVVAPDGDPLAVIQGTLQPCKGDVGIGHQAGVVQRLAAGVEECGRAGRRRGIRDAPGGWRSVDRSPRTAGGSRSGSGRCHSRRGPITRPMVAAADLIAALETRYRPGAGRLTSAAERLDCLPRAGRSRLAVRVPLVPGRRAAGWR